MMVRKLQLLIISLLLISLFVQSSALAVTAGDWSSGRIIDDGLFTNSSDMSVQDIQNFLKSRLPYCDKDGVKISELGAGDADGDGTVNTAADYSLADVTKDGKVQRWEYGRVNSNAAPFTCLTNYYEVPKTSPGSYIPTNNYGQYNPDGSPAIPTGAVSAAQIIANAAQEFSINPKALLIKLATESAGPLTSDEWPFKTQYLYAMGAHCPDSGPGGTANCDLNYSGFSMQIREAANLLRGYLDNMTQAWWPYKRPGPGVDRVKTDAYGKPLKDLCSDRSGLQNSNCVGWNVPATCGGTVIYIETKATAALYTYTPYQPNAAALNNMYGTGDACSAYGNRNFWRVWNDWFGSTQVASYSARPTSQSPFPTIASGLSQRVFIRYLNQGSSKWYDSSSVPIGTYPVLLAATDPINRSSPFSSLWASPGRPSTNFTRVYSSDGTTLSANQHVAEPGQYVEWEFELKIPPDYPLGTYRETFQPVLEGSTNWAMGGVSWLDITVKSGYIATPISQSIYAYTAATNSTSNQTIRYRNDGENYWYDTLTAPTNDTKPVRLAKVNGDLTTGWPTPTYATSTFGTTYLSDGTTPSPFQHVVRPGEIVELPLSLTLVDQAGIGLHRQMVRPQIDGFSNSPMGGLSWFDVTAVARTGGASLYAQSPFPTMSPGAAQPVFLSYKNTSNTAWYDSQSVPRGLLPIHIATYGPINRSSPFSYDWYNRARPVLQFSKVTESDGLTLAANQHIVQPGQIAFFNFNLVAPWSFRGTYREYYLPIVEGSSNWNQGGISWLDVKVQ
jgi:hypothetical protein